MATDWTRFAWGGVQFPLDPASPQSLLQDADPALFQAIAFYSYMIETYVGARLVSALAAANVVGADGQPIAKAVATAIHVDPFEHATSAQYALPTLALYRVDAQSEQITVVHAREVTQWSLVYMLPPLDAEQALAIEPVLHAIKLLLQYSTQAGWDPAYVPPGYTPAPGGDPHPQAWKLAGLDRIDLESSRYGAVNAEMAQDLWFPAMTAVLRVKERGTTLQGLSTLQGVDATIGVQPPDGSAALADVVEQYTWVPIPKPGP